MWCVLMTICSVPPISCGICWRRWRRETMMCPSPDMPRRSRVPSKILAAASTTRCPTGCWERIKICAFPTSPPCAGFVRDEVIRYRNPYPYISGLMLRATSRVCNVDMEERERTIGAGHYTFKKSFALWMNSFTAFSVKPLRVSTACGCICAVAGLLELVYVIVRKRSPPACPLGTAPSWRCCSLWAA